MLQKIKRYVLKWMNLQHSKWGKVVNIIDHGDIGDNNDMELCVCCVKHLI
jgi:hypothetical protein